MVLTVPLNRKALSTGQILFYIVPNFSTTKDYKIRNAATVIPSVMFRDRKRPRFLSAEEEEREARFHPPYKRNRYSSHDPIFPPKSKRENYQQQEQQQPILGRDRKGEQAKTKKLIPISRRRRRWVSRDILNFKLDQQVGEGTYG